MCENWRIVTVWWKIHDKFFSDYIRSTYKLNTIIHNSIKRTKNITYFTLFEEHGEKIHNQVFNTIPIICSLFCSLFRIFSTLWVFLATAALMKERRSLGMGKNNLFFEQSLIIKCRDAYFKECGYFKTYSFLHDVGSMQKHKLELNTLRN